MQTPSNFRRVRVLIADDHGLMRAGLRSLLNAESGIEVVGEAQDGFRALELARTIQPDIVLADLSMPGPSGIEIARLLGKELPSARVVILTMHEDPQLVREARQAGAYGYVIKRAVEDELIAAVRAVAAGQTYVHPAMLPPAEEDAVEQLQLEPCGGAPGNGVVLEELEARVINLIARGYTTRQVTAALGPAVDDIEAVRHEIMQRFGLRGRADIVRFAVRHGLLES